MPTRAVDTSMWGDPKVAGLSPLAKLVFMRLVSGDEVGTHGGLKVNPRRLAGDLSGDAEAVSPTEASAALEELVAAGMVRRYDDWLWLPQFLRYQMRAPGFGRAALKRSLELPDSMRRAVRRKVAEVAELHGWEGWNDDPDAEGPLDKKDARKQGKRGSKGGLRGVSPLPDPDPEDLLDSEHADLQDEGGSKGGLSARSRPRARARAHAVDKKDADMQDEQGSARARVSGSGQTHRSDLETDTETAREPSESAERGRELLERLRDQTNGSAF